MAVPTVLVDTTFTGKDINVAASVYEYTATANVTLRVQVCLAAVAGGGDYVAYLTLNDGDAVADLPILPKTTMTAAAGETAFWFTSMAVDVLTGDVINVFVDGLAGDTSEAGTIRITTDATIDTTGAGLTAIPWNAAGDAEVESEVDDALGSGTGTALTAIPWNAAWDAEVQSEVDDSLATQLADSVPADGTRPTVAQAIYMIVQFLTERAVVSTTCTVKKVDGSTALMTFTLNDATDPTSITRTT